ncbi:MAG: glycosyltransferase family 4 protein [Solirubrobacteraceae bacterium]
MSRLRLAIDGRPLQGEPLGVARYLSGVLPVLAQDADVFVLLEGRRPVPQETLDGIQTVPLSAPRGVPALGWLELAVAPWLRRFDGVFHGAFNLLPLTWRGASVLTLHDLAPQLHPEDFRLDRQIAWRLNMRAAVRRARRITTVSEFVRGQIVEYFKLAPEQVVVAPDAVAPVFNPDRAARAPELARALGIAPPYIVALGGAPRRGLPVAIEAWRTVKRQREATGAPTVALAVLGQADIAPEPGLVQLRPLEDEDWATLLAGAQALCYPTRYEGFGLPALEAAASGTPVVCTPVASLPEVLGDAGCWAASPSPDAIAEVLHRVLHDPQWHGERRSAGLEQARSATSFAQTAAILLEAYRQAAA